MKAFIIEDSPEIVEAVSVCLQLRWPGSSIMVSAEGRKGIEILKTNYADILILDINLPDVDGFYVLQQIRAFSNTPIIILTVRDKEEDRAHGLEIGADDYIVKPFRPLDLVARISAVLRRYASNSTTQEAVTLIRGELKLNLSNSEVSLGGKAIKLTATETKLLYVLMDNSNITVSHELLLCTVWKNQNMHAGKLRAYVHHLRNKLGDNPPSIILTDHNHGYKLVTPT